MDRASILGDAIDYLKELLQRINDLHHELESTPPGSLVPSSTSLHPLTPTPPTLPSRVKDELCPSSLPSPKNQAARVIFVHLALLLLLTFGRVAYCLRIMLMTVERPLIWLTSVHGCKFGDDLMNLSCMNISFFCLTCIT